MLREAGLSIVKPLEKMYISYVRPILEYGDIMLSNMTEEQLLLIENVNKRAGKISGATAGTSTPIIYDELGWASMETRRKQRRIFTFHKVIHGRSLPYLRYILPPYNRERSTRALRNSDDLTTIHARLDVFYKSYFPQTVRDCQLTSDKLRSQSRLKGQLPNQIRHQTYYFITGNASSILSIPECVWVVVNLKPTYSSIMLLTALHACVGIPMKIPFIIF